MRLVVDTFEFGSKFTPRFNTISISGYHIREAGSTALQELAFTLYDGVEYVEWAQRRGLDVDEFGPRLSFFFNAHNDFFEEIAKYRAARKIWYQVMKDRFGAKNQRTWLMRFHTQTAGVSLTAQQPLNNIARAAIQAMAAVLETIRKTPGVWRVYRKEDLSTTDPLTRAPALSHYEGRSGDIKMLSRAYWIT